MKLNQFVLLGVTALFTSVVIWCRMANATFGYATLGLTLTDVLVKKD